MIRHDRYLHFENIDLQRPEIISRCSQCKREFGATPKPGERIDEVLLRIRAEYEAHECLIVSASKLR
jgi:hypothetical protein